MKTEAIYAILTDVGPSRGTVVALGNYDELAARWMVGLLLGPLGLGLLRFRGGSECGFGLA